MIQFHDLTKSYETKAGPKLVLEKSNALFATGRNYAIMGANGAGKSSVMRLIAGSVLPTSGFVDRNELVSWPLGFHGGFNSTMTGRENVLFVARVYGQDVERILHLSQKFAEIGAAFDEPVGNYSSGMKQRLAYGLSLAIKFHTYLIDETIAVGDARFRRKCEKYLNYRLQKSRVIVISHSIRTIRKFCDCGMLLWKGQLYEYGNIEHLIKDYERLCS